MRADRAITLDKSKGDVGVTLANSDDGLGVVVLGLEQSGLAIQAGLKVGDVILRVNGHAVDNHAGAIALVNSSRRSVEFVLAASRSPDCGRLSSVSLAERSCQSPL